MVVQPFKLRIGLWVFSLAILKSSGVLPNPTKFCPFNVRILRLLQGPGLWICSLGIITFFGILSDPLTLLPSRV